MTLLLVLLCLLWAFVAVTALAEWLTGELRREPEGYVDPSRGHRRE